MKDEQTSDKLVFSLPMPLFEEEEHINSDDEDIDDVGDNPEKAGFLQLRKLWKKLKRKRNKKRRKNILDKFIRRTTLKMKKIDPNYVNEESSEDEIEDTPIFSPSKLIEKKSTASLNTFLVIVHESLLEQNKNEPETKMAPFYLLIS